MVKVTLLDYGAGNVKSLYNALVALGCDVEQTDEPAKVAAAAVLLFPGVGAFGACMSMLERKQLVEPLKAYIRAGRPFLGICLGMQTLFEASDESPGVRGLGIVPGTVGRFDGTRLGLAVPQIGWNGIIPRQASPLLDALSPGDAVYFVHSFRAPLGAAAPEWVLCETEYGERFVSGIQRGKVAAVQFHPEKSGPVGLAVLGGFISSSLAMPPAKAVAAAAHQPGRPRVPIGSSSSGLCKRIVACLDVRANDKGDLVVTKGDQYDVRDKEDGGDVRNLGKPVALARRYYDEGADEVTFLNITGFRECPLRDLPMLQVLSEASRTCFVPMCVGGGIKDMADADGIKSSALQVADAYFRAGADKVSLGSDAVDAARAYLDRGGRGDGTSSIETISAKYGAQACVVSIDPRRVWVSSAAAAAGHALADHTDPALGRGARGPAGETLCWYECTVQGGRKGSNLDVVQVARAVEALGCGELLVNCIDCDGQHAGFDLPLMAMLKAAVAIPVIASSGAGTVDHFTDVFAATKVEAALAASIFHRHTVEIAAVKAHCARKGYAVRTTAGATTRAKYRWVALGVGAVALVSIALAARRRH